MDLELEKTTSRLRWIICVYMWVAEHVRQLRSSWALSQPLSWDKLLEEMPCIMHGIRRNGIAVNFVGFLIDFLIEYLLGKSNKK